MGSAFNSLNAQQIWKNLNSWKTLNALQTTNRHEVNLCLTITYSLLLKGDHFDSKFDGWRHSLSSDQYTFSLSHRSTNLKKKTKNSFQGMKHFRSANLKKNIFQDMKHFATSHCLRFAATSQKFAEKWLKGPFHSLESEGIKSLWRGWRCSLMVSCVLMHSPWSPFRDLLQIARHDKGPHLGRDGRIKEPAYASMNLRWDIVENVLNQLATIRPESNFSGIISMDHTQTMTYTDDDLNEEL